jgi:hypothetical protein
MFNVSIFESLPTDAFWEELIAPCLDKEKSLEARACLKSLCSPRKSILVTFQLPT